MTDSVGLTESEANFSLRGPNSETRYSRPSALFESARSSARRMRDFARHLTCVLRATNSRTDERRLILLERKCRQRASRRSSTQIGKFQSFALLTDCTSASACVCFSERSRRKLRAAFANRDSRFEFSLPLCTFIGRRDRLLYLQWLQIDSNVADNRSRFPAAV